MYGNGDHGTHYGKIAIQATPTGAGLVYLNTSKNAYTGNDWAESSVQSWMCDGKKKDSDTKTFYANAQKSASGYWFSGWSTAVNGTIESSANPYAVSLKATSSTEASPTAATYYAIFKPVEITGVAGDNPVLLTPAELRTVYTSTVVFTQNGGTEQGDFNSATIASVSGNGTWTVTATEFSEADKTVKVTVAYQAERDTYKNNVGTRTDEAELKLSSLGGSSFTCKLQATFPITIEAGQAENITLTYPEATAVAAATFPVLGVDAKTDVQPVIQSATGAGQWEILSWTYQSHQVIVQYRYTGIGRGDTALLTLAAASAQASCTVRAESSTRVVDGKQDEFLVIEPEKLSVSSSATFTVAYAAGENDFLTPVITPLQGDAVWSLGIPVYTEGTLPVGIMAVPYTFSHNGTPGDYTAQLTLQSTTGSSFTVLLNAVVEKPSDYDAAVITAEGVTTQYEQWTDALAAANKESGCTLRLLRNVALGALTANQEIKQTMTLDLNGKTLSATLPSSTYCRLLYLNTADITLTITDSRSDGQLQAMGNYNGALYAVQVAKGNLILDNGMLEAVNNTTNNQYATAVYLASATSFTMNGGTLTATHIEAQYAAGVDAAAGSMVNINGGTINATAKTYAYAVRALSNATNPSRVTLKNAMLNGIATTNAYGICSAGIVNVMSGTIKATTQEVGGTNGGANAYGIYMQAVANADAALCYYGELTLEGGTVTATTATTASYAVYIQGTDGVISTNTPDGTHTNKSSAIATLRNCTLNATAGTYNARGITVDNCYNSRTNTATPALLENVTINAVSTTGNSSNMTSCGVYAAAYVNNTHGAKRAAEIELTDCNITAVSTSAGYVYGVYLATAQSTITAENDWKGERNATAAKVKIRGGSITATAATLSAYAINSANTVVTTDGNPINSASTELSVADAVITATTQTGATAYGIQTGGPATIDNCQISASAATTTARGISVQDKKTTVSNTEIEAVAGTGTAYGLYLNAAIADHIAFPTVGEVELNSVHVNASTITGNNAYGLYLHAVNKALTEATYAALSEANKILYKDCYAYGEHAVAAKAAVNGGSFTATAAGTTAHGISCANTAVSTTGKASASTELSVMGATVTALTQTGANAYGIQTGGPATIDNCQISATAATTAARGVNVQDKKTIINKSTITAIGGNNSEKTQTTTNVITIGIYVSASVSDHIAFPLMGEVELNNVNVSATTKTGRQAYALQLVNASKALTEATYAALSDAQKTLYKDCYAYGAHAVAAKATVKGGTYEATAQNTDAYAILCNNTTVTTDGKNIASASIPLTVADAVITATTQTGATAYGIQTGGPATIDNCQISASAATTTARGISVQDKKTTVSNTEIEAVAGTGTAYGLYLNAAIADHIAFPTVGEVELNSVHVNASTITGNNAYGLYLHAVNKALTEATYAALSEANKILYKDCYAYGEHAVAAKAAVNGGSFTATAAGTTAHGISCANTAVSTTGKASASTELSVMGATVTALTQTGANAYGIQTGGSATIDNCQISASAATTTARGIFVQDKKTTVSNTEIEAVAGTGTAHGIYVNATVSNTAGIAGWLYKGELESDNNTVYAEVANGKDAYAIWLHAYALTTTNAPAGDYAVAASALVNRGVYTAKALAGANAYAIGIQAKQTKNDVSAAPFCTINDGKFWGEANTAFADIHTNALVGNVFINNGYFRNNTNIAPYVNDSLAVLDLPAATAEYKEGYRYMLGDASNPGVAVCKIVQNGNEYKTLGEALQFVNAPENVNTNYTILMLGDYRLPAGDYVLPQKATLLIPYKKEQTTILGASPTRTTTTALRAAYHTLTLAQGANLTVSGTIEVSAEQYVGGNPCGSVYGPYGYLRLEQNASLQLENNAVLYAWGYVSGKGTITAKKGARIYEDFQIGDWKGGSATNSMQNNKEKVFPITHYFYQNIECPIVYYAGARAYGASGVNIGIVGIQKADNVLIIGGKGSGALFLMDEQANTDKAWIRKEYDPLTDRTHYILNSSTTLGSLVIKAGSVSLPSEKYILPISSNMTVTLNYGTLDIEQDTYLLPGSILNINKEAALSIPSGHNFYVIDKDQWETGYSTGYYIWTPAYSPSWENPLSSPRKPMQTDNTNIPDAEIFVHGKVEVAGGFFTTEGGADIHSTNEDAGVISFLVNAAANTTFYQYNNSQQYSPKTVTSASLRNENTLSGEFTSTTTAAAGNTYNYIDGAWRCMFQEGCLNVEIIGTEEHLYVQAGEMVEVVEQNEMLYKSVNGDRYFIFTEKKSSEAGCQWWEAVAVNDGMYMAANPKYDNYGSYYYYNTNLGYWELLTAMVYWYNADGSLITSYPVPVNQVYSYTGTAPVMPNDATFNYVWAGWKDAEGNSYKADNLPAISVGTESVSYTAYFTATPKEYSVTFLTSDYKIIESALWKVGEVPVCRNLPLKEPTAENEYLFGGWLAADGTHYTNDNLPAVTDVADYRMLPYIAVPRPYLISFVNYDGTLLWEGEVPYGTLPFYQGYMPTREGDEEHSWRFIGWDKALEPVAEATTYVAQFMAVEREYGELMDVVDWTDDYAVLNMNGYSSPSAAAGWQLSAAGNNYTKSDRQTDRTLHLNMATLNLHADELVQIEVKGANQVVESSHCYTVPYVYQTDANLETTSPFCSSVIFLRAGKLTVTENTNVAAIYVAPGAELYIAPDAMLVTAKLVLRTEAFASAVLTNHGMLKCDDVCYSRIVREKAMPYPFALPFETDLQNVHFSNGKQAVFGTDFGLMAYDAEQRAYEGYLGGGNWKGLNPAANSKLQACEGYRFISASAYYSEYCFHVNYNPDTDGRMVMLKAYGDDTCSKGDRGWNSVCSPYTSRFACNMLSPEKAVKISVLNTDNTTFRQVVPEEIEPASPFFYQSLSDASLVFNAAEFAWQVVPQAITPKHIIANTDVPTQWLRLQYIASDGYSDETSIYLHPDKFDTDYNIGYDVLKFSKAGTRPFLWSSLSYGDMAFASLPDSVATKGIALTFYTPSEQHVYMSLVPNDWQNRMEHVWLEDKQENIFTDLLFDNYSWKATEGECRERFVIYPVFRQIIDNDDINDALEDVLTTGFIAYAVGRTIVVESINPDTDVRCYDATGRLVANQHSATEQVLINVPASGIYLVRVDDCIKKVMVNK
ncbi:MAG: hypothetical protein NC404_07605 [Bacteroidales bacterium]|nr:hypothetical protein [Bacteroidales bacterium]